MKKPVLDNRTTETILEQMRRRAASYTPEWRFDNDPSDPGAAIAEVFGEMYTHTLDRFNALPQKYYTDFLNMIGVTESDAQSAACYVRFHVHGSADGAAVIPEHTLVAAADEDENGNIVFETDARIEATPANLESIFYYDPRESVLQKLDTEKTGHTLFGADGSENLSSHELYLCNNEVLAAEGSCYFRVEPRSTVQFQNQALAELLGNSDEAEWHWFDGESWVAFDEVAVSGSVLILRKKDPRPMAPDEEGRLMIRCRLFRPAGEMTVSEVLLSSAPEGELPMEAMWDDDLPLEEGRGFCFGHRPMEYGLFYMRSDRVFCKRGSNVAVQMQITTEVDDQTKGTENYDWTQYVINKDEAVPIPPDDVTISRVIWEYFNGNGWAVLPVKGDVNPFGPGDKGKTYTLTFRVPDNMESTGVNAEDGYYIRARIAAIDNLYSTRQRWFIPYITKASCTWQYETGRRCTYAASVNDLERIEVDNASGMQNMQLRAFCGTEAMSRCLFLRFDRSPDAMPLTLLFQMRPDGVLPGKVRYESLRDGRYYSIPTTDGTRNFRSTGIVSLYIPEPLTVCSMFGEEGCWLRVTCEATQYDDALLPIMESVDINVTGVLQRQQAEEQYFDTESYAKNKEIRLLRTPVQGAEVWVEETGHLTEARLQQFRAASGKLKELKDEEGELHQWIRWERTADMRLASGDDRVYELDTVEGVIRFGDDHHGHIPPEGNDNIAVYYSYGGGPVGNLPVGQITNMLQSVSMVDSVTNVTTACGGMDGGGQERLKQVGILRLRHRNRAVGPDDFEQLVLENFPRVCKAKCFSGLDQNGSAAAGNVTLVFLCTDATNTADTEFLGQTIFRFLSDYCDCTMVASNRLHVVPAPEMSVCVEAQLELKDLNLAADTQKEISASITSLIDDVWRQRGIGEALHTEELYKLLAQAPNVAVIRQLLIRGTWTEYGVERACNLEEEHSFPYFAFHSGNHLIHVM